MFVRCRSYPVHLVIFFLCAEFSTAPILSGNPKTPTDTEKKMRKKNYIFPQSLLQVWITSKQIKCL